MKAKVKVWYDDKYDCTTYADLATLADANPDLANELLTHFGKGEWINNELRVYDSIADLAAYEVCEGWYGCLIGADLSTIDYNGAPSLFDFIDLEELGKALQNTWDNSIYYLAKNGNIVVTN